MSNLSLAERGVKAAVRFVEGTKGYDVVDTYFGTPFGTIDIVAFDEFDNAIHFIESSVSTMGEGFAAEDVDRNFCEMKTAYWLAKHPGYCECAVKFDRADMMIVANDKAMLRFHENYLS